MALSAYGGARAVVSNPHRYGQRGRRPICDGDIIIVFQTLIGMVKGVQTEWGKRSLFKFQTLIGTVKG